MTDDIFDSPPTEPATPTVDCKVDIFGDQLLVKLSPWNREDADKILSVGGRWHRPAIGYLLPGTIQAIEALITVIDCRFGSDCRRWIEGGAPGLTLDPTILQQRADRARPDADVMRDIAQHMEMSLAPRGDNRPFPYQIVAAAAATGAGGRFLFGDIMGLGKTVEALTWLSYAGRSALPALIVCTASGRLNWVREARRWLPDDWRVATISSGADQWSADPPDVLVMTYGLIASLGRTAAERKIKPLPPALASVKDWNWQTIIVDEAHRIASSQALQSKAVKRLGQRAPHFLALSATPVMTGPINMHNILRMIAPDVIGNKADFGARYCGAEYHQFPPVGREVPGKKPQKWWTYDGTTNVAELRTILDGCMIRRTREEVKTELPTITRITLPVDADAKEYRRFERQTQDAMLTELTGEPSEHDAANAMQHMMHLWAAVGGMKVAPAVEWLIDYCAGQDRPAIAFYHHHSVGDMLAAGISDAAPELRVSRIDGSVTGAARYDIIRKFQAGEIEILLATTKAAGESITLTRACDCLIVERQWTAYSEEQAEGRIDRHGQTTATTATYLCAVVDGQRTIDEDMADLVSGRRLAAHDILDPDIVHSSEMQTMLTCAERLLKRSER